MRLQLIAVGRLRAGPERMLVDDYLDRFAKTGRGLGLPAMDLREVEAKGGPAAEAAAIERALTPGARLVILDERGRAFTSPDLAAQLAAWRDDAEDAAFVIGGADGLDPGLRARADLAIVLRRDGLAAHARPRHDRRATLSRRLDPRRLPLSSGLRRD